MSDMKEYTFTGDVKLRGVVFTVHAETEDEAIEKAKSGDYEDWDGSGAEVTDCHLNPKSCEENA